MRRSTVLKACLGTVAVAVVFFLIRGKQPYQKDQVDIPEASMSPVDADGDKALAEGRTGVDQSEALLANGVSVSGVVIDAEFETPIAAQLYGADRCLAATDARTGAFLVRDCDRGMERISVRAAGYYSESIAVPAGDGDATVVRLTPNRKATITVLHSDHTPAAGVLVIVKMALERPEAISLDKWLDADAHQLGKQVERPTDHQGTVSIAIGERAIATIRDPASDYYTSIRIWPEASRTVIVPSSPIVLRFVDERDGSPVPSLSIESWCPRDVDALAVTSATNGDGLVKIFPTSLPIIVRRKGNATWQGLLVSRSPWAAPCGLMPSLQPMIRIASAPLPDGPIEIGVTYGMRARLVDAQSSRPVSSPVRIQVRARKETVRSDDHAPSSQSILGAACAFNRPDAIFVPVAGYVEMPNWVSSPQSLLDGTDPSSELVLTSKGYESLVIHAVTPRAVEDAGIPVFQLKAIEERRLKIIHSDGVPCNSATYVYSPVSDTYCWSSIGTPTGVHGPFDWNEGPLKITVADAPGSIFSLDAGTIQESQTITLELPFPTGGIRLIGKYPTTNVNLVAKLGVGSEGRVYTSSRDDGADRLFLGLCPGPYLVGPEQWVLSSEFHSVQASLGSKQPDKACLVQVKGGEVTAAAWPSIQMAQSDLVGTIRVLGARPITPLLIPDYELAEAVHDTESAVSIRMLFSRLSPRISLDNDGTYRIRAGEPQPRIIAVCIPDDTRWGDTNGLRVVETILPGESTTVDVGDVQLHWEGEIPGRPLSVGYELPVTALRYRVHTFHQKWETNWAPKTPLLIPDIPVYVQSLKVGARLVDISIRPASTIQVRVIGP